MTQHAFEFELTIPAGIETDAKDLSRKASYRQSLAKLRIARFRRSGRPAAAV